MCVLNQRQQSVRNSSASMRDSKRSAKTAGSRAGRSSSTGEQNRQPRFSKELGGEIPKATEPIPENLMISPIERPALMPSIPPDWLIEDSTPQFVHSGQESTILQIVN